MQDHAYPRPLTRRTPMGAKQKQVLFIMHHYHPESCTIGIIADVLHGEHNAQQRKNIRRVMHSLVRRRYVESSYAKAHAWILTAQGQDLNWRGLEKWLPIDHPEWWAEMLTRITPKFQTYEVPP